MGPNVTRGAASGYDVWLGDCRGNHNSPTNNFDFTFDEMAAKDLPALLNGVSAGTARAQ